MRHVTAVFALLALAACQQGAPPLSEADRAAIDTARETYRSAVVATDPAAIAAAYTPDAVEMPPNAAPRSGRDAIAAGNAVITGVTHFTISPAETAGYGDLAVERGAYVWHGSVEGLPAAIADTGKYMVVYRKQADGSWIISRAMWSSNIPLPMMPGG